MFKDSDLDFVRLAFKTLKLDDYGMMQFEDDDKTIIMAGIFEFHKIMEKTITHSIRGDIEREVPVIALSAIYECTGYDGMPDCTESHYGTFPTLYDALMTAYLETERWKVANQLDSALWQAYKDEETLDCPF